MVNKAVLKRLEAAEATLETRQERRYKQLVSKMTTEELQRCLDDKTTDEQIQAIVKGAIQREC